MAKFLIPVWWCEAGEYKVEADSMEEAKQKVIDAEGEYADLPKHNEYIDYSLEINHDCCMELD